MKQEFKLAKGWSIVLLAFFIIMILAIPIGAYFAIREESNTNEAILYIIAALAFESLFLFLLRLTIRNKVIVDDEKIIYIGAFVTKTLFIEEIKGFRTDKNYLHFFPMDKGSKKIQISTYFGKFSQLLLWAERHCKNLDQEQFNEDTVEILNNEEYGYSADERAAKLSRAKKQAKVFNGVGGVIALSTMFLPYFYEVQIILCALLPLLAIGLVHSSKGLIKLNEKKGSAYPSVIGVILLPPLALVLRAFIDFELSDYAAMWLPCSIVFILFVTLVFSVRTTKYDFSKPIGYFGVLGVLLIGATYAYGLIGTTNAAFDTSEPSWYQAEVKDKRVNSGENTYYYLELSEWGPKTEVEDVSVSADLYEYYQVGDSVNIYFSQGLFKVPYFVVTQ